MNIYIATPGTRVGIRNGRIEVKEEEDLIVDYPLGLIDSVTLFPGVNTTPTLVKDFAENKKSIFWLNQNGKTIATVTSPGCENIGRVKKQFLLSDDEDFRLALAQRFISAKINNQFFMLGRYTENDIPEVIIEEFIRLNDKIGECQTIDELMGAEGMAARMYFEKIALILPKRLGFMKRTRQPPRDIVSSALGFSYSLLYNKYVAELLTAGLNPNVGFLHDIRAGHYALASDMMEELRAVISDNIVFSLFFSGDLTDQDFEKSEDGAIYLARKSSKKIIAEFEKAMSTDTGVKLKRGVSSTWAGIITTQVYDLIRSIEEYDPSLYNPIVM